MSKALAIKYRPNTFDDLTEQGAVKVILTNQIMSNTIKHAYLFCGGAGTGKTTSARIFANMINGGEGTPIELDAASNNSVDDIRKLCDDAQTQSIDCEYKVFIIDECHSLSNQAWQAFLKTLEEPPAKSIFVFCTTDPQKIPKTILSRVQRYDFQRISHTGIVMRLFNILESELDENPEIDWEATAIDYIAKIADGGMRDAITLMDKCLSYSNKLTMDIVVKALGVADYDTMDKLTQALASDNKADVIKIITSVYNSGVDLKFFIRTYFEYVLDLYIFKTTGNIDFTKLPVMYKDKTNLLPERDLLSYISELNHEIKWAQNPKALVIAKLMLF